MPTNNRLMEAVRSGKIKAVRVKEDRIVKLLKALRDK